MDPHLMSLETGTVFEPNFFYTLSNLVDCDFEPVSNAEILKWPINLN
jgi:hypothetical protein